MFEGWEDKKFHQFLDFRWEPLLKNLTPQSSFDSGGPSGKIANEKQKGLFVRELFLGQHVCQPL